MNTGGCTRKDIENEKKRRALLLFLFRLDCTSPRVFKKDKKI